MKTLILIIYLFVAFNVCASSFSGNVYMLIVTNTNELSQAAISKGRLSSAFESLVKPTEVNYVEYSSNGSYLGYQRELSKIHTKSNDILFVFFLMHGSGANAMYPYLSFDSKNKKVDSWTIAQQIVSCQKGKVVVCFDVCFSGESSFTDAVPEFNGSSTNISSINVNAYKALNLLGSINNNIVVWTAGYEGMESYYSIRFGSVYIHNLIFELSQAQSNCQGYQQILRKTTLRTCNLMYQCPYVEYNYISHKAFNKQLNF